MVRVVVFLAGNIRDHGVPTRHTFARRTDHGVEKELIVIGRVVIGGEEFATEVHVQAVLALGYGYGGSPRSLFQRERPAGISGKRGQNPGQTDTVCGLHCLRGERFLAVV